MNEDEIYNIINKNFSFFDDENRKIFTSDKIKIKKNDSCAIGGLENWMISITIYYNNEISLICNLVANVNGTFIKINGDYDNNGNKIKVVFGDLNNKEELEKFEKYIIDYSIILQHNYKYANQLNNKFTWMTFGLCILWLYNINNYNYFIYSASNKKVLLFREKTKKNKEEKDEFIGLYNNIEELFIYNKYLKKYMILSSCICS
jgi:hypothetical protein